MASITISFNNDEGWDEYSVIKALADQSNVITNNLDARLTRSERMSKLYAYNNLY